MDKRTLLVLLVLLAGIAYGEIIIGEGMGFKVDGNTYLFTNNVSTLNITFRGGNQLAVNETVFQIYPDAGTCESDILSFSNKSYSLNVTPSESAQITFNMTGWENETDVYVYREGVFMANFTVDDNRTFAYQTASETADANWFFTQTASSAPDTGGSCLTPEGYSRVFTGTALDAVIGEPYLGLVIVNFTGISQLVHVNLTNVYTPEIATVLDDYTLLLDISDMDYEIHIGGSNYNYIYASSAYPTPDLIHQLSLSDLTLTNMFYTLDIRHESNGDLIDISTKDIFNLTVLCNEYAPDTVDLIDLDLNHLFISTKEQPTMHFQMNTSIDRKYQPYVDTEDIDIFMPGDFDALETVSHYLEDYTGGFGDSYLQVVRNVNASLSVIWQQQWYHLQVPDVDMENNTYYQYQLYTPTDTRIIAWKKITNTDASNGVIISVREPSFEDSADYYEDINLGFTSDYGTPSVGVAYDLDSPNTLENLTFRVYNYSTSTRSYVLDYETSVTTGNDGTITYVVPDQNSSYYLEAELKCSGYDKTIIITDLRTPAMTEERFPFYDSWNLPSSIMGLDKERVYTGVAVFLFTTIAMMISSLEVGVGAILLIGIVGLVTWFGWFREMTWNWFLLLASMAILYKFVERRRPKE